VEGYAIVFAAPVSYGQKTVMRIGLRSLTFEDLNQVMEIEPVAFGSHHWSYQSFVNELNNPSGYYWVAYNLLDNAILGYSGFWLIGDEAHVTTLAVHPDLRRQSIGELLLINDILQAVQLKASWMTLEVRVSNEIAQQLYYRYGFKSLGVRKKYYQDNDEDALVLWAEKIGSAEFQKHLQERTNHIVNQSVKTTLSSLIKDMTAKLGTI
jgi:ribosomal-protein-alanine N-acetyltransferase